MAAGLGAVGVNENMAKIVAAGFGEHAQIPAAYLGWFPSFWLALKGLFNVGHGFVLRKLLLLLCPFVQREQGAPAPSYSYGGGDDSPGHAPSGSLDHLKANVNEPD